MTNQIGFEDIDWPMLGRRYREAESELAAVPQEKRPRPYSNEWYGEIIRRIFEQRGTGFVTEAESLRVRDAHTSIDRLNRERAEEKVAELRDEVLRKDRDAAADVVRWIRANVNERTMPSKFRREGALQIADWLEEQLRGGGTV